MLRLRARSKQARMPSGRGEVPIEEKMVRTSLGNLFETMFPHNLDETILDAARSGYSGAAYLLGTVPTVLHILAR